MGIVFQYPSGKLIYHNISLCSVSSQDFDCFGMCPSGRMVLSHVKPEQVCDDVSDGLAGIDGTLISSSRLKLRREQGHNHIHMAISWA